MTGTFTTATPQVTTWLLRNTAVGNQYVGWQNGDGSMGYAAPIGGNSSQVVCAISGTFYYFGTGTQHWTVTDTTAPCSNDGYFYYNMIKCSDSTSVKMRMSYDEWLTLITPPALGTVLKLDGICYTMDSYTTSGAVVKTFTASEYYNNQQTDCSTCLAGTTTTTTTTFSNNPCICTEVVVTSAGAEVTTFNCYGVNENYVYMNAGTYYLCAASIGGLLQASFVSGTGTISPVGNCKTGTCPPQSTTTTTAGPTTTTTTTTAGPTTTTTTTTAAPIYYYNVTRFRCFPCGQDAINLIASSPVALVNHIYYNNGDGYVYYTNFGTGAGYVDVDLTDALGDAICSSACSR
jgi:hypothetical protein